MRPTGGHSSDELGRKSGARCRGAAGLRAVCGAPVGAGTASGPEMRRVVGARGESNSLSRFSSQLWHD